MDLAKPKTAFAVVLQVPARHSPCQAGERGPCWPLTMAEWINSCLVVAKSVASIAKLQAAFNPTDKNILNLLGGAPDDKMNNRDYTDA